MYILYGAPGWGSAITELMLCLCHEPYRWVNVDGFDQPGEQRDRLMALNPLCQVPTLQKPDGTIMTESAAIALMLAERHPHFVPPAGSAARDRFYHWLIWLVANIYPTFTYGDYPERWTRQGAAELVESSDRYRERGYLWLESQLGDDAYLLGDNVTLIDAYLPPIIHWRPRQPWFAAHTPKLYAIAQRVSIRSELKTAVERNGLQAV